MGKGPTVAQLSERFHSVLAPSPDEFMLATPAQNKLMRQLNFPSSIKKGENMMEFWTHQLDPGVRQAAFARLKEVKDATDRSPLMNATEASFLSMAQKLVGRHFKAQGVMAVRFTLPRPVPLTTLGAYEMTLRITVVGNLASYRTTYNGYDGPHVLHTWVKHPVPNLLTVAEEWGSLPSMRPRYVSEPEIAETYLVGALAEAS